MCVCRSGDVMSADPFLPYVSRVPLSFSDSDGAVATWLEGTLLFVDVAGFTALSERLGRTGRAGAEELTGALLASAAPMNSRVRFIFFIGSGAH